MRLHFAILSNASQKIYHVNTILASAISSPLYFDHNPLSPHSFVQFVLQKEAMEQLFLNSQHSGSMNHVHSFLFPTSAIQLAKELRLTVTIVALAWVTVTAIRQFGPRVIKKRE